MPTKILVADDSATMRRVLEMTFAGEDATVVTADSAEAALAKAAEIMPDVMFADASMAGVDGYELARRIKTHPQLGKLAVILMASQQVPYDEGKGRAAGVDDHIAKPFDTQSVIDRVGQVLARARALPGEAPARAASPSGAKPAISAPGQGPGTGTTRLPQGGGATRVGLGGPTPVQPTPAKPGAGTGPQPMPALRQGGGPVAPAPVPPKPAAAMPPPTAAVARPAAVPAPAPVPAAAPPAAAVAPAAVQVAVSDLGSKLSQLGLTREQVEGVLALSREVIEQVVWEVVPDLAEQLIKEEIKRLTAE